MLKTGLLAREIKTNDSVLMENVTVATISNTGATDLYVEIDNVEHKIPALREDIGLPFVYNIPADGFTAIENLTVNLRFSTGKGKAIVSFRKIKDCEQP